MTYAWGRMAGRCLDVQRAQHRQQRLLAHLAREPICVSGAAPAPVRGITTDQLAVRQALVQVGPLSSAERLVVERHYGEDQPLHEVAAGTRHSADSLQRAHRKLLGRLRTVFQPPAG
jgi:DNA-directed RNA polymerase specialized sigma24 family protein